MVIRISRARKPALLKQGNSESKEQLKERAKMEEALKGNVDQFKNVPDHLDDLAQQYYRFLVSELEISDILSNLDIPLLEQTADCLSKTRQADEILNSDGIIISVTDKYGNITLKEHPAVNVKQKYLNQFRAMSQQLGLSPASRAQLAGMKIDQKNDEEDPLLQLLQKKS